MTENVQETVMSLRKELKDAFIERDEEVDGLLVAVLSRQHVLLIGPRGTAKSMLIARLAQCVKDTKVWTKLFTKFTVPEEVFGPVKISALKDDRFERKIEKYLPSAEFAFADEIFKANSSILNALLTILNEREFDNDAQRLKVPLETMMGASNELPSDESLLALYDRFLLRFKVQYIQEQAAFKRMLELTGSEPVNQLSLKELHWAQKQVSTIPVPDSVFKALIEIREMLKKEGVIPSDRRYKQALDVIRAYAYIQGKTAVTNDDISILTHVLWDEPTHISIVERVVIGVSNPLQRLADEQMDAVNSAWKEVEDIQDASKKTLQASEATAKINKAIKKLDEIRGDMEKQHIDTSKIDGYIRRSEEIVQVKIAQEMFGIGKKRK